MSPKKTDSHVYGAQLFAPVCSVIATRRRRFLWAAWWTAPPTRQPFRKPDASSGGARSHAEALAEAEKAAGGPLLEIEPDWARAHARVLRGEPPFPRHAEPRRAAHPARRPQEAHAAASVWAILGITAQASTADVKRAYRQRALETHPDRGGQVDAFRQVQSAYSEALRRSARPRKRAPKPR
jgi:hypothetical protein